jgi:hypothetical protein
MAIENDPSARMQLRSAGELMAPATCAVCGSGNCEEGYLDLATFVEFHGTIYLCMTCLVQAGETAGMFTMEQVQHLNNQLNSLLEANTLLTSENQRVTELNANLNGVLAAQFGIVSDVPSEPPSEDVAVITESTDDRESEVEESVKIDKSAGTSRTKLHDITFN